MWNKVVDTSKLVLLVVIKSLSNSYTIFEITIIETDYTEIDCKWTWKKSKYARDINILNKLSMKHKEKTLNAIELDFLTVCKWYLANIEMSLWQFWDVDYRFKILSTHLKN